MEIAMTCKRLSSNARMEQDYWLSFVSIYDNVKPVTEAERIAFLRYDSHGGEPPIGNPILVGKSNHDLGVAMLKESYVEPGWAGLLIVADEIQEGIAYRDPRKPLRRLRTAFPDNFVHRWLRALMPWA